VSWAADALRDIIGRTELTDSLRGASASRRNCSSSSISDRIPGRHGRVGRDARRRHSRRVAGCNVARGAGGARKGGTHLGEAELAIAHSFEEAAKSYQNNPTALHLRAMNMLYEGLKEKGALMLIPSSAVSPWAWAG
jgi:hypothetical protein